ncbi:hypothetical protein HZS_1697 [Henneguya salminicola]|nr:hypothetical protein HZS_1697 [Henneguya salminicola]
MELTHTSISQDIKPNSNNLYELIGQPTEYSYFNTIASIEMLKKNITDANFDFLTKAKNRNIFAFKKNLTKVKKPKIEVNFLHEITQEDKKRFKSTTRTSKLNSSFQKSQNYELTTHEPLYSIDQDYLFLLFIKNTSCLCLDAIDKASQTDNKESYVQQDSPAIGEDDYFEDKNIEDPENINASNHLNISLIPRPIVVDRLFIKYAKVAKRLDTKVVKTAIWKILENTTLPNGITLYLSCLEDNEKNSFIYIHKKLVETLPKSTVQNLSPQLSFVCLLHLANEKNLQLINSNNLSNIDIHIQKPII